MGVQRSAAVGRACHGPEEPGWPALHSAGSALTLVTSIEGLLRESNPLALTRYTRLRTYPNLPSGVRSATRRHTQCVLTRVSHCDADLSRAR
jgi:hypothetical protein